MRQERQRLFAVFWWLPGSPRFEPVVDWVEAFAAVNRDLYLGNPWLRDILVRAGRTAIRIYYARRGRETRGRLRALR
jgi:hypothetical protein